MIQVQNWHFLALKSGSPNVDHAEPAQYINHIVKLSEEKNTRPGQNKGWWRETKVGSHCRDFLGLKKRTFLISI